MNLKFLGYYGGRIDGIEGNGTISAYEEFQSEHELKVDGIYGPKTDAKLVEELGTKYNPQNGMQIIQWESRKGLRTTEGGYQSPATRLEHEFAHAIDDRDNPSCHRDRRAIADSQYENKEERRVITGAESKMARLNHESVRHNHLGRTYNVVSPTSTTSMDEHNE